MRKYEAKLVLMAREKIGITQLEMARRLGMTSQFLGKIEKGEASLPLRFVHVLMEFSGLRIDQFLKARLEDKREQLKWELKK